jgi:hypothetical protein
VSSKPVIRSLVTILALSLTGAAYADAQDDAIRAKCPSAQAWFERQDAKHPELSADAVANENRHAHFTDPALRAELRKREETDVATRNAWIAAGGAQDTAKAVFQMDRDNIAWMKPLFTRQGFPTAAQVGRAGVSAAFLLVQHADQDPAFQASMLAALVKAGKGGEIMQADVAMLTDRVLLAQHKPQRYGTQYDIDQANLAAMKPQPTEEPAHVDERRASMGLMPRADYECVLRVTYATSSATP